MRNVGVIGAGYWSVNHLQAWQRINGVRISALCDKNAGKLREKGRLFGLAEERLFTSVDAMLAQPDIHIVDIVTGPETHLELVGKAARAGKHILCQKPFAQDEETAEEMVRIAKSCGVRLMVTENWRWLQPHQTIKQILDEGRLGALRAARYTHTDYYTPRMAPGIRLPQPFFREMPRLLFYEMGAHWFDTMRFFFGEPKRLYAEMVRVSPHIAGEDTGVVTLGYDGFYAVMDMSWAARGELERAPDADVKAEHREQMVIEGELATLKLRRNGDIALIDGSGREKLLQEGIVLDHADSHVRLQSHFIEALDSGKPFQTGGEDNLKTLRLMFSAYRSAQYHEVIHFRDGIPSIK